MYLTGTKSKVPDCPAGPNEKRERERERERFIETGGKHTLQRPKGSEREREREREIY